MFLVLSVRLSTVTRYHLHAGSCIALVSIRVIAQDGHNTIDNITHHSIEHNRIFASAEAKGYFPRPSPSIYFLSSPGRLHSGSKIYWYRQVLDY